MKITYCLNCMKSLTGGNFCPFCGFDNQNYQPSPYALAPHTILNGKYVVGRVLGQGGFGITYVGFDLSLEIKVAIKEYFPMNQTTRDSSVSNELHWNTAMSANGQWQNGCESFLKEARKMAKMDAIPEIVGVRETFLENNTAYIIMNYVEGVTLKDWLMQNGPMDFNSCIELLLPLMEGLDRVHQQGLIHRDISPDNIMIQPDGKLRLLDLGAAKDLTTGTTSSVSQMVTKHGFSPLEQYMESGEIGPWTDVYALCATIYYCVTGLLVPDPADRLDNDKLDFARVVGGITKEQADVLAAGLAVRKDYRIQSVSDLVQMFLGNIAKPVTPVSTGKKSKKKFIIAACACALAAVVMVVASIAVKKAQTEKEETVSESVEENVAVEELGCTNANLHQGANYARIPNQYTYYADKEWNFYVSPYDEEANTFWIGTEDMLVVDDEVGFINVGKDKVYFIHDETQDSGNSDSLMQMDYDGSHVETVLSDGQYIRMQYVRLTDGQEYLYYLMEDDNTEDLKYILCRYDLSKGLQKEAAKEIVKEGIYWFNLYGNKLYFTLFSEESRESEWKYCSLDGENEEILNDDKLLLNGYIEDGTAYMFSWREEVMYRFSLDGEEQGAPVVAPFDGCSVYGDGWIYYCNSDSNEVHRMRPDGSSDSVVLEGYHIIEMCYADSELWTLQGKIVNNEYVLQQTILVYKDGSNVIVVEQECVDTMPVGLVYRVEDDVIVLEDYSGEEKRILIPWVVDEKPITNINRGSGFPKDVDVYCYPQDSEISYELTKDESGVIITGCGGGLTDGYAYLALPAVIDDLPVVELGEKFFSKKESLKGIMLPDGLKKIGTDAFEYCTKLAYVQLPDSIQVLGDYAFYKNTSLKSIELPEGLKELDSFVFGNSGLETVEIPSTLESIKGGNPFLGCDLRSISVADGNKNFYIADGALYSSDRNAIFAVPARIEGEFQILGGIELMASYAFSGSSISEVTIPSTMGDIAVYAFEDAKRLVKVTIEEGPTEINEGAFSNCSALQEITIPKSVKVIDKDAFSGCKSLKTVTISRDCKVEEGAFDSNIKIKYY